MSVWVCPAAVMKYFALILLSLYLPVQARPALEKPNVVVIFLDDCGYGDFSHTGNPTIHTPHVSRMVHEGANFPQFYAASPACSASRYALLTGRNPRRSGLGSWVLGPGSKRHIHPQEVTLAEGLKHQGYATGFFGKWHLGTPNKANQLSPDAFPLAHGFDVWEGTNVSNDYDPGVDLIRSNPQGKTPIAGYEVIAKNITMKMELHDDLTRRYRDLGVQFIKDHKEEPFLLYLAPNMPHLPVHAGDEFKGKSLRGLYGDCIEEIDAMIGSLLKTLEDQGIAGNTLVILSSDNGPWIRFQDTASHPKYGEARLLIGSALPFRDGKGSTWEGGVREVGVWYWPGTIPPATVVRTPASTMDILPTAFALAGEPLPSGRTLDGRDIRPFLNGSKFPGSVPEFEFVYTGNGNNVVHAARKGPWKLHTKLYSQTGNNYGFKASPEKPLLFNVEEDPSERIDRSSEQAAVVGELQGVLDAFKASLDSEQTFWGAP
ncbi:sulfatase family protein [Luteolibacter marinus]|uniref:sulfatase family protein n=1 Tax=Luteolibacter marinus TaxID=2776705 RepID=UPI0018679673|nr:sulfatase [Luteolibacter marinus]